MCPPLAFHPAARPGHGLRRALQRRLARFGREEDGVILAEFLVLLPVLVWAFLATFVYWDTFRTINEAQKASYAVADMISRQKTEVTTALVNGLDEAMEMMMTDAGEVRVRLTSVQYSTAGLYVVLFSRSADGVLTGLNTAAVTALSAQIPLIAPLDSVVILETEVPFTPAFDIGISDKTFRNFVVTRPRSLLRICLSGITCPTVI